MDKEKKNDSVGPRVPALGRRDMIKLGVGASIAATQMLKAPAALAQQGAESPMPPTQGLGGYPPINHVQQWPDIIESEAVVATRQTGYAITTGPGWVNNSGRSFGNGPMDTCSRRIVEFVSSFTEPKYTDSFMEAFDYLMVDTLSALYGGFESEPARINARLSQKMPGPCTLLGYGIKTTYEMAAFGNGAMIRHTDFNAVPHNNEMFGGILAVAEAVHATGPQTIAAMTIAYEVLVALGNTGKGDYSPEGWDGPYHSVGTAMGAGKLMGLNEDQLANAIALAMVPHMPMYVCHIGVQSMWKGTHSSEAVRNGVWGAMLASEGMTGPCTPFEGRDGLIAHIGPFTRDLRLPTSEDGRLALETLHSGGKSYKRFPAEGSTESYHESVAPALIAWTKPEEVASIEVEFNYGNWQEIGDPTKWDPRNRETADHSMPYNIARHLLDGYIYLDSFEKEKYMDPKVRELMNKITIHPVVPGQGLTGIPILTVRKKSGEERVFKAGPITPMTHDDIIAKYNKIADFMQVDKAQAARALKQWMNLRDVKDIGDALQTVAKFGQPKPLSDRTPARIS